MSPNSEQPPGSITEDQIRAQVDTLSSHQLFQGSRRLELLHFLLMLKQQGRYKGPFTAARRKPTGRQVLVDFYAYLAKQRIISEKEKPEDDAACEDDGKKVVRGLVHALTQYYANPGTDDQVVISIQTGKGPAYEPLVRLRSQIPT